MAILPFHPYCNQIKTAESTTPRVQCAPDSVYQRTWKTIKRNTRASSIRYVDKTTAEKTDETITCLLDVAMSAVLRALRIAAGDEWIVSRQLRVKKKKKMCFFFASTWKSRIDRINRLSRINTFVSHSVRRLRMTPPDTSRTIRTCDRFFSIRHMSRSRVDIWNLHTSSYY